MKTFKDTEGREWALVLNVGTAKQVKTLTGVDLLDVGRGDLFATILSDPYLLANVLYALCRDECVKRGISDEDFGRGLAGDAIDEAAQALMAEIVAFFPLRKRQVLMEALATLKGVETRLIDRASELIRGPALMDKINAAIASLGN